MVSLLVLYDYVFRFGGIECSGCSRLHCDIYSAVCNYLNRETDRHNGRKRDKAIESDRDGQTEAVRNL